MPEHGPAGGEPAFPGGQRLEGHGNLNNSADRNFTGKSGETQGMLNKPAVSRKDWLVVSLLCAGYAGMWGYLSLARHLGLRSFYADTGMYANYIWNLAAAYRDFLGFPFPGSEGFNHLALSLNEFGSHADPIIILLAVPYALFPDPITIYVLQALAIASGGIAVFLLARRAGLPRAASYFSVIAFFLYPPLEWAHLYECNPVKFSIPFLLFAVYFLEEERYGVFALLLFSAGLCKEHLPLVMTLGGILLLLRRKWKWGALLFFVGLIWFFINFEVLIPAFHAGKGHVYIVTAHGSSSRYNWLGGSVIEIIKNIIIHPLRVSSYVFNGFHLRYYADLLFPLLCLPLFRPDILLLALPGFLANSLSTNLMTSTIYFYHSAETIPFLIMGYILVWGWIFRRGNPLARKIIPVVILANALAWNIFSVPRILEAPAAPSPLSYRFHWKDYQVLPRDLRIREVARLVPPGASLSVQGNLGPHLANRSLVGEFPGNAREADFILVGLFNPWGGENWETFTFANHFSVDFLTTLVSEFESGNREVAYGRDGYLLLRKGKGEFQGEKAFLAPEINLFIQQLRIGLKPSPHKLPDYWKPSDLLSSPLGGKD